MERTANPAKAITVGVIVFIVIVLLLSSFGVVDAGERGIKVRLGNVKGIVEPGVYFKWPFIESVKKINIRTQSVVYERENPLTSASSDLQDVNVSSVTNYHVDPTKVVQIYLQYKDLSSFEENVIRPTVRDSVKASASKLNASELINKRAEFADNVARLLNERLADKYVIVEQSNITDIKFSESFSASIEAKVKAQQDAETAKNNLVKVQYEQDAKLVEAKTQAETISIQAKAVTQQGGAEYVKLQWIDAWKSGGAKVPTTMLGSQNFMLNLNDLK